MSSSPQLQWSTIVPNTARSNRGEIHRARDPLVHPELGVEGSQTLYEGLRRGAALNPLGPCLGFRAVSTTGIATPYIYSSYTECVARVDAFAAGLHELKLVEPTEDGMVLLGLYLKNCMEWVLAEHAIFSLGGATVPLYDTLGPDTVEFILKQTGCRALVCTRSELAAVFQAKDACPDLASVILVDGLTPEAAQQANEAGVRALSYAKVEAVGAQSMAKTGKNCHSPPSPNDIATFCYTSGTTGDPKGAMLSHANLVSSCAGYRRVDPVEFCFQPTDRHLSYLPLAHIFERIVQAQVIMAGASIGFFRGDPTLLIEDLQACRPTFLPVAPRVLNKIYDKIQSGIASAGGVKKKLFDAAVAAKTQGLQHGHLKHAVYDRLIFDKIKRGLGMDHVRLMVSGSAPLAENVMTFYRCLLGVPVGEGYGQTEGASNATLVHPEDMSTFGHVGGPTGVTEICLEDVPEMGYLHTDTNHRGQPCLGRGEICIRGPNVFLGYYKDEAKTRETIDEQGWLHSGDVGLWRPDGNLQIIDRKKNIFKLSQGEYVAPEKIENILIRSPLIAQCFVYGDSLQSSLVAIVVPDEEPVRLWANGDEQTSFVQLCNDERLKQAIMDDIVQLSKDHALQGFETVKAIYMEAEPFSVEADLLTPTFKLKRDKARDRYEREIEELYAGLPPPRSKL